MSIQVPLFVSFLRVCWASLFTSSLLFTLASPASAQESTRIGQSFEVGAGRDEGKILMWTLFSKGSPFAEWVAFDVHVGEIQRQASARLVHKQETRERADEEGGSIERFAFYGADVIIGHRGNNPHIVAVGGKTYFSDRTHRLDTKLNYHWALQLGYDGDLFGIFLRVHHWSNGQEVTDDGHTNLGEDFGTLGLQIFF